MSLKKSVCLVSVGTLIGVLVYGCSSSSNGGTTTGDDAGGAMDGSGMHDSAPADAHPGDAHMEAAVACAPGDVSGFMAPAYVHAHQQTGACTDQQIADFYSKCLDTTTRLKADCDALKAAAPTCTGCIEVPSTAATWGATFTRSGVIWVNVGGCMELLGGADGLACAKLNQAASACNDAACAPTCPVTDDASFQLYEACIQQSAANGCMSMEQQAAACETTISMGDGGAVICTQGSVFQDFYNGIVPIFCGGGGTADAGDGG
jgi:hypothetical protein